MKTNSKFLKNILIPLEQTVKDASHIIMDVYNKNSFNKEIKSDGSPVTEADFKANELILDSLNRITPDIPIISEETYSKDMVLPDQPYWLVDPLDGTKEFINKSNDFTVNIALIEESIPIFGIIAAPASGAIWYGSFFQRPKQYRLGAMFFFMRPFAFIPWFIQSKKNGPYSFQKEVVNGKLEYKDGPLRLVMSKSHKTETDQKFLEYLSKKNIAYEVVEKGSSLKLCCLADNDADIYPRFGPTSEWDIAAGHAYLVSKGGRVSQMLTGEHLAYTKEGSILNPAFVAFRNTYLKDRYLPLISEFYKKLV